MASRDPSAQAGPRGAAGRRALGLSNGRLHLGHFAFMRAVLQGVDPQASWHRYLRSPGEAPDTAAVRRTIQWVRDEFAAAARRFSRHGTARLVLIDAARIPQRDARLPTLDEFADAHGLHDFSYQEQLEQYQSVYGGATRQQSRRGRLLARQLEALAWLERVAVRPPDPADPVSAWLNPVVADRLERAGIMTLRQLLDRINGIGMHWARGIPGVGPIKSARIVDWLRQQEPALQMAVGEHAAKVPFALSAEELDRIVPRATAVVPMDKLMIPAALNGAQGRYRAPAGECAINAANDRDAVLAWLETKSAKAGQGGKHTQRAYLKEAERFLLWAVLERRTALSSLGAEDCLAYCRFIADPVPADLWCGSRGRGKWSPLWRPFEGPLSTRAQRFSITVLKNLFKYLHHQRYLAHNAWESIVLPPETTPRTDRARSFSAIQWELIANTLEGLADTSANRRLRLAVLLLRFTGLRLGEAVAARVGDLRSAGEGWRLHVKGQGGAERIVSVPPPIMDMIRTYLASRGLPPDPLAPENQGVALLGRATDIVERAPWSAAARRAVDSRAGISPGALYDQLKEFFACCDLAIEAGDASAKRALKKASTEWLRHTHTRHTDAAGT